MILFFDTYITDKPLITNFVKSNDYLRSGENSYCMPSKIAITKYTLESYALYPWKKVIIRCRFGSEYSKSVVKDFYAYVKLLFPQAIIIKMAKKILVQEDFKSILQIINKTKNEWIFYSPNNDHPMISSDFMGIFSGLSLGDAYAKQYDYVSIVYSHYSEFIRAGFNDSKFHQTYAQDADLIEDNHLASVFLRKNGENSSIQIVNNKLLNYWFNSKDLGNAPIVRAESIRDHFLTHNQLMIVPKSPICAHFDGYSHTVGTSTEILPSLIPPLFLPLGFFEKDIKIAFGYDKYRKGWVNINPISKYYVFDDHVEGMDLKILLSDLPMAWRGRVSKIDVYSKIDWMEMKKNRDDHYNDLLDPWNKQSLYNISEHFKNIIRTILRKFNDYPLTLWPETIHGKEKLAALGLMKSNKPFRLHVGCGARVLKDWINIDLFFTHYKGYIKYFKDKYYDKSVRGTINDFYALDLVNDSLPLSNNSVELIFHEDFIEHLDQKEQYIFLAESFRVLKIGAVHRINTPEITNSMKIHSNFELGNSGVYKTEWDKHIHKNILSIETLTQMAKIVGYSKIIVQQRDVSVALIPNEYRPDPQDRSDSGNIHIDLIK